jgi:hypothetical protein
MSDGNPGQAQSDAASSLRPQAQLQGPVRGWGEVPRDAFAIGIAGDQIRYGEWRPLWQSDHTTFSVEVISFGFPMLDYIGHPQGMFRHAYSEQDGQNISDAIIGMFADSALQAPRIIPFSSSKAIFTGEVQFRAGWIKASRR